MSPPAPESRNFAQFILHLEEGQTHSDLTDSLSKIAEELNNHVLAFGGIAKAGLTLSLEFKADKGVIEITADIKTKLPKAPRMRSIMWTTPDGAFTPSNPRQLAMFGPREIVDGTTGEVRTV